MLLLPLDHPEPFAATLGVMLYPGSDDGECRKAKAFASQLLAAPISQSRGAGHDISYEVLAQLHGDGGEILVDLQKRWRGGLWTGDLFKVWYALAQSHQEFASLENAIRIAELSATRTGDSGVRSSFMQARKQFVTVAHLWAAWSIRDGSFVIKPEVGYNGFADFQAFLMESEILRDWGQNWRPNRAKAKPPLPAEMWRVPEDWLPPARQAGWPEIGIPYLSIPEDLLTGLRPAVGS